MEVLDKKVQLEILDEVANNAECNVVRIDSLTPEKQFNFKYLADKNFLQPEYEDSETDKFRKDLVGATTLTEKGQEFRLKLIEELEVIEMRRLSVEALQGANRRATCAMLIAIVCAFISAPSWVSSFLRWCFSL